MEFFRGGGRRRRKGGREEGRKGELILF